MRQYYFLVLSFFFAFTSYAQDAFEPNETISQAAIINTCVNYNANLDTTSDVDFYEFSATNGQTFNFEMFYIEQGQSISLILFDSTGGQLASWSGTNSISQSYTFTNTSNYYISVSLNSGTASTDDYLFYIGSCLDTDGDGLLDTTEDNITNTDPNDADTDDDTLLDSIEVYIYNTNPLDADSDDDGISDGGEINIYNTIPLEEDTDGDGLFDGTEVGITTPLDDTDTNAGYFIADVNDVSLTNPLDADTDGDGLLDGEEDANKNGSTDNPTIGGTGTVGSGETDPNQSDSDTDNLSDGDEVLIHGTNPLDTDTDDGGVDDGIEINVNTTDPLDSNDDNNGLTFVPDDNFENYLETHDANGNVVAVGDANSMGNGIANDDYVTTSKINTVEYLFIPSLGITDLTGVEDFVGLKNLQCFSNQLTSIDVSNNTVLELLYCNTNQLSSLDVSSNPALKLLICGTNAIGTLDLTQNPNLYYLNTFGAQLTSLNVKNGNNTNFTLFQASNNPNLNCIVVDDIAYSNANWTNKDAGATFVDNPAVCSTLSLDNDVALQFNIHPNPTEENVFITATSTADYQIVSINGQLLIKGSLMKGENNIDVSSLTNGIYFVRLKSKYKAAIKKLIKH